MKEWFYDKLLNIKTTGYNEGDHLSIHFHRYEATPYSALERLFEYYSFKNSDRIVDYGCGKGRLNFFIHHTFNSTVIGIEMNDTLFNQALKNKTRYLKGKPERSNIQFIRCLAEDYPIHPHDNRFYFFNPFSIQIFMNIVHKILHSAENHVREIELILYYPSDEYIYYLEKIGFFELKLEVQLDEYKYDPNERFLIYRLMI